MDTNELAALYQKLGSGIAVAKQLGISKTAIYERFARAGIEVHKANSPKGERVSVSEFRERHKAIIGDLERGLNIVQVALSHGISHQRVGQIARRAGMVCKYHFSVASHG